MLKKLLLSTFLLCTACGSETSTLTFEDIEGAGFEKGQQQYYQMVGASDGWSGEWNDEDVEVYTFENPDDEGKTFHNGVDIENNPSNWADKCLHKNIVMISTGEQACQDLKTL